MLEAHYFPLSVALLQRPLQSYILAISLTQKQIRYLHHEQCIHTIPFTRIIRISPYSPTTTTPSPSHHSQHSTSSSLSSLGDSATPTVDLSSSPSLSLTLHVVGSRIGDTDHIHHHTHSTQMRDGLLTLLLTTVTPDNPPLLPSFYPLTLSPMYASTATKRGKWGTDAQRWMALVDGGRLLLFRKEPTGFPDSNNEPLTAIMLSELAGIEKKGSRKLRLRGAEREWELGVEGEAERDEWCRLLIKQREAVIQRAEEWQQEWREKRAEEDDRRQKQLQAELARLQLHEDEHKSSTPTPTAPITPHSLLRLTPDKAKRKTMPSPAFFVNAQVMAARNKRGSLSIKTRVHQQQGQAGSGGQSAMLRSASGSEREESRTAGFSMESSGHISPAISPWSAVTPRLGAQQLPPSVAMLRAATAASLTQPPLSLSSGSRLGPGGGSPSPAMAYSSGYTLPPSPLLADEKHRSGGAGSVGSAGDVLGNSVRALEDGGIRRSSMTTW